MNTPECALRLVVGTETISTCTDHHITHDPHRNCSINFTRWEDRHRYLHFRCHADDDRVPQCTGRLAHRACVTVANLWWLSVLSPFECSASRKETKSSKRAQQTRQSQSTAFRKVRAANKLEDPLKNYPEFKNFNKDSFIARVECLQTCSLSSITLDWAFGLTKTNMQAMYEKSEWGWSDQAKQDELQHADAWYLIVWDSDGQPVAFSNFRFDLDYRKPVLYCYEIQLEEKVQRNGLGTFLMHSLHAIASSAHMNKVVLTVFKHNAGAQKFFRQTLQYKVDETSPGENGENGDSADGCCYDILSRHT
uniref:N-alpha-acetyltransferase 40 n=1 Tax=Eptatretus burgeri TaxID=7764 RepID=A0A8C4NEK1_EPTBU